MTDALERLLKEIEEQSLLLAPSQFRKRIEALDQLEACLYGVPAQSGTGLANTELSLRAQGVSDRLNAVNLDLYRSLREEILQGHLPIDLLRLVDPSGSAAESDPAPSGLAYDALDELVAGVLEFEEPEGGHTHPGAEMVFYQPTPARHIFHLLTETTLSAEDVLIDLGSGLGHVPLLAAICTPARAIGIEREPAYAQCARRSADGLGLKRVTFLEQDARQADLSQGTVFYLYTPFIGTILASVLQSLRRQAHRRPIRIATFGPCSFIVSEEPWLETKSEPQADRIVVFHSRALTV